MITISGRWQPTAGAQSRWLNALAAAALFKVVFAVVFVVTVLGAAHTPVPARQWLLLFHAALFASCGAFLFWSGRADTRARVFATFFMVTGAVFGDGTLQLIAVGDGLIAITARAIAPIQVDAFTPLLLWRFVAEFPRLRKYSRVDRIIPPLLVASTLIGVFLVAVNIVRATLPAGVSFAVLDTFARQDPVGMYWTAQYPLIIAALGTLVWRTVRADSDERRRAQLLVAGITVGVAPTIAYGIITVMVPSLFPFTPLRVLCYPALLSIPFTTTYAVLVERAFDVRLVLRQALQRTLARYSALVLVVAPLVFIVVEGYRNRSSSLASLLGSPEGGLLLGVSGIGVIGLVARDAILERVDRRFFREQYDARQILARLVEQCRSAADTRALSELLEREIDRALHVDALHVMLRSADGALVATHNEVRPIEPTSPWWHDLEVGKTVAIDLERDRSHETVSTPDLEWATDANARLLIPLRDGRNQLTGVITLGEKKSELPYSPEDLRLLGQVAAAAELAIGYRTAQPAPARMPEATEAPLEAAVECTKCGLVQRNGGECRECGGATAPSLLPLMVGGKLSVERRIGAGGMGVVYRARDTHLDRVVALKTLPHVSPAASVRLRREARIVAAVSHPNLALIYGAETWRGRPMLVFEHLGGGTLDRRIAAGPLSVDEVVAMGIALSSALVAIHDAGLLHRDIKPSNIAFATPGEVKLLDFGLARVLTSIVDRPGAIASGDLSGIAQSTDSVIQGTPLYMSPEALAGAAPEPGFDLWALCMVLYEACAGVHPWREQPRGNGAAHMAVPDVRRVKPDVSAPLADLLNRGLSLDASRRPRSAHEIHASLGTLLANPTR